MYAKINSTDDYDSAWDYFDHGSHTSSIPLGNYLASVSFFGYACGTARGMAPAGRVAMHKIIWSIGITVSDVLPAWRAPLRMELMGNDRLWRQSMYNGAPWILTVGASIIDRAYGATLLNNGSIVTGSSIYYSNTMKISSAPLVFNIQDSVCERKLVPEKVNGTVVLCMTRNNSIVSAVKAAGAVALLMLTGHRN
ncbi:subtilisin-like protease SBT1.7 [Cryptomeria japonica]|uniref:subtilisin-like protease SBT1.7 n=1 Tax=Cryptomeria japonica TaxID=3369 RepID=UPI0027D9E50E|nr:subtilisin-like protease SBT1.7 [Cryptomeria japonica]